MARKALIVKQQKLARLRKLYLEEKKLALAEGRPMRRIKGFRPTKYYNRCQFTWRSKWYMREFGVCRVTFRDVARQGLATGVQKASR